MNRVCPNCGREMEQYEMSYGPGGLGCAYCTENCPSCGREIFASDLIYDASETRCVYCEGEKTNEPEDFDDDFDDDDYDD